MPDYDTWNRAVIAHFTRAATRGAPVFLSVDDDALVEIGYQLGGSGVAGGGVPNPVEDFLSALRARVVRNGRVSLDTVDGTSASGEPLGVAFLGTMVLAVTRMHEDDELADINYFGRLRELLGLPPGAGRPPGLATASEVPLWQDWSFWLQVRGYLATAREGTGLSQKFINYALSQALLREVDKDQLHRLFQRPGWRTDLDADSLLVRMRRELQSPTVHLRELLTSDSDRLAAVAEAVHQFYEQTRFDPPGARMRGVRKQGRVLYAGLYRDVDPLSQSVTYYLYPRIPTGAAGSMQVQIGDHLEPLRPDPAQPGHGYPLGQVDGAVLAVGARYEIDQPAAADALVLPKREFWILAADPDDPDSGVYASRGQPRLGQPFILLYRQSMAAEVRELREEHLIEYGGEPLPVLDGSWFEARDCLVVSEAWTGAHFASRELYDALRPVDVCSVGASGGLRLPDRPGWLDDAGPRITVFGFEPEAEVVITSVSSRTTIVERTQRTGEPVDVAWPGDGVFLVEATCGGQRARRLVTLGSWDELRLVEPETNCVVTLGDSHLIGAALT